MAMTAQEQVDRNYEWFIANLESLMPRYGGMWVLLKDCAVVEMCNSINEGYRRGVEKYGVGNFSVQKCVNPQPVIKIYG